MVPATSGIPAPESVDRRQLQIGVIGCGYWGPNLIRNFDTMVGADLAAVADMAAERRAWVSRHFQQARVYRDHRELLASDVAAVVVATPVHTHYEVTRDALMAGKHVLVEKPLASSAEACRHLIQLAAERGLCLMVGHTFLYNPAVRELRRLVQNGDLGRVYYVDGARLNLGLFQRHLNVIWDLAPHDLSILLYVLERRPVEVSARGASFLRKQVQDVAYLEVIFEDGVMAQLHLSWLDPSKVRRMTVVGDRKMAVFNETSMDKLRIYNKGVMLVMPAPTDSFGEFQLTYRYGEVTVPHTPPDEPLAVEAEHFVDCVRNGHRPLSHGEQGLAVVVLIEAANRSLEEGGRRIAVDPSDFGYRAIKVEASAGGDEADAHSGPAAEALLIGRSSTEGAD